MQLSDVLYLANDVTWKKRSFGSVLFKAGHKQKVLLNATATQFVAELNGLCTGAEIAALQATRYSISTERAQSDVARLFEHLLAGGWLTANPAYGKPADADETFPPLDSFSFALTHRCNLRCRHCYIRLTENSEGEMTTTEWLETIRQLKPFKLMGVVLTGGEPLLRTDLWELVEAINSINVDVILCTNGTLIDPAFVERVQNAKLSKIQISLDGALPEIHDGLRGVGAFAAAWHGIELAQAAGLPLELSCTVTRPTATEYLSVIKLARQRNLPVSLGEFLPLGPARELRAELELDIKQFFQLHSRIATLSLAGVLRQKAHEAETFKRVTSHVAQEGNASWHKVQSCLGRDSGGHILPGGEVLICPMLDWPDLVGGNVRHMELRDIWEHSPVFQQAWQCTNEHFVKCRECANRCLCGGTCRALTLAETGEFVGRPNTARCFWEKIYYGRMSRVMFNSTEPLQTLLERENLLL